MKNILIQTTLLTTLFLSFCLSADAQRNAQDVIYLKNGSVIRGKVESQTSDIVSIRTADQSLWVFNKTEINKQTVEKRPQPDFPRKGFYNTTNLGFLHGRGIWSTRLYPSVQASFGYQFNEKWSAGLGTGLEQYDDNGYLPLFAEGRFDLLDNKVTPFATIQAGYTLPIYNEFNQDEERVYKGGVLAGANIGVRTYFSDKSGFTFSVGYKFQETSRSNDWWWGGGSSKSTVVNQYHSLEIRIGFLFR